MEFGIDWNGPSIVQDDDAVNVPNIICPLGCNEMAVLQSCFNPHNCTDEDLGVQLYLSVRHYVHFCVDD